MKVAALIAIATLTLAHPASARDSFLGPDREGASAIKLSGGFTDGPDTALTGFELAHFLTDQLALAPVMQLGVSDEHFLFAPSLDAKLIIDLDNAPRLLPFVQGGLGFAYVDEQRDDGLDDDDAGFLIHAGAGADWFVTDRLSIGTEIFFNFLPGEVQDEDFFFSWHVLTFTIWF